LSLRYIGSKARVAAEICAVLGRWKGQGRFIDAFCGTGIISRHAAELGWPVHLNDHLVSSVAMATAQVISSEEVPFEQLGGYVSAIAFLEGSKGIPGFVWREYSPASRTHGVERRYFTEANAYRIDGIRSQIASWQASEIITRAEERLLVADLIAAANRVANIAGTYGCFLRNWSTNALHELSLEPRALRPDAVPLRATCMDVFDVTARTEDTVYLDPPYTKRQYAAYYHVLETIAQADEPEVAGVTGLRPWEHKASPFCYKARALDALVSLVAGLGAQRILLSYNDEGHVTPAALTAHLSQLGDLRVYRLATIGRYRPNERASANGASVAEYLLDLRPQTIVAHEQLRTDTALSA
jgi:adenine-specific DNA-methyltransferase